MKPGLHQAKISGKRLVGEDTFEITLSLEDDFDFRAGQYVWLILPKLLYEDPRGNRRAFSICSSPSQKNSISVAFRNSGSGFKKTLIELPENSLVQIDGPFGAMGLPDIPTQPLVMIAGGIGITPFLSMIRYATEQKRPQTIILIYANSNEKKVVFSEELQLLARQNPYLQIRQKIGELDWNFISQGLSDPSKCIWSVIGPQGMVNSVGNILLNQGIKEEEIIFEEFFITKESTKISKEELLNKVEVFKQALDSSSNHIIFTDVEGRIIFANKGTIQTTQFNQNELLGQTPRLWGGLMDKDFYHKLWKTIKVDKKPFIGEINNRRKNGEIYTALAHISPVLDDSSELLGFLGTEEDISEILQVQEEFKKQAAILAESDAKDKAVLGSIGEGLIAVDKERKMLVLNGVAEEMLGWKKDGMVGKIFQGLPFVDEKNNPIPIEEKPIFIALKTGKTIQSNNYSIINKNGAKIALGVTVTPVILKKQIIGAVIIFRDITKEKEIDKMKTEFVSLASHQLRTPLGISKWYLEALKDDDLIHKNPQQVQEYVEEIYKSNERLIKLVKDLLNVSRIDQSKVKNEPLSTDIYKFIEVVVKTLEIEAGKKQIKIALINKTQNLPQVNLDQEKLREVVENLLSNAIKYTNPSGNIEVTVGNNESELLVDVKDNGMGIPLEDQSKIFTRFFRTAQAMKNDTTGSGLGLYIVKSYVEGWGGKIWFESEEGKGTTFHFSLPLKSN